MRKRTDELSPFILMQYNLEFLPIGWGFGWHNQKQLIQTCL